ncbi:MAG TPA: molecular chaperone HtpG [Anaerolineales bacterium]|nr:molecular chaperone HtpG [Anaerolineales bacterium]
MDKPQTTPADPAGIPFKAETRQLLDILIHSLYTEREIFLRELLSNAADALTRLDFELLTNRDVADPDLELAIRVFPDKENKTLTIQDTGIGMTATELAENLGTIAHSGARKFMEAVQESGKAAANLIGQFGVGFYSAFMVAESIQVTSRSYLPVADAAAWTSTGSDTYTITPAEKAERGSTVTVHLKEDALEFADESRLREIIRKHSDFIPFPIYIGDGTEQVNKRSALWRQSPREVKEEEYTEFYKQLTLDFEAPLTSAHMVVDAPVQMYALLFIPSSPERSMFSLRKEDGLKVYARKVLIQEYNKTLLPEYLGFVQGVVDSEDLPLNVSRESVQSNKVMAQLKKLVTSKVLDTLKKLAKDDPEKYAQFWKAYSRFIKQGIAIEPAEPTGLYPLLRFRTLHQPEELVSLDEYITHMQAGQEDIYYILGDDERSVVHSPHLDVIQHYNYDVLILTDPVDPFMLVRLHEYQGHKLVNVANADLTLPAVEAEKDAQETSRLPADASASLVERFKRQLGERVTDVRITGRLSGSPARLVDPEGALNQEMQRVYRLLDKEFDAPKKVLELNPAHPILVGLHEIGEEDELSKLLIEQVYEDALLIEGIHPDPASMITRIQEIMQRALK